MIAVIAKLNVAEGQEAGFEEVMLALAGEVRANEPGNQFISSAKTTTATTSC